MADPEAEFTVVLLHKHDPMIRSRLAQKLMEYNLSHVPPEVRLGHQPLDVVLRDRALSIVGGLVGCTYMGILEIAVLWVDPAARKQGHGTGLLQGAQEEARRRGCEMAVVDTFGFQAREFYEGQGFTMFARIEGCPGGQERFYFLKRLQ